VEVTDGCRASGARREALARATRLEIFTVGWNVVEGVIAVTAALLAGSTALFGFGVDSFVESASGGVMLWRLRAEMEASHHEVVERIERRAQKLVAASLLALALYVAWDAASTLVERERPRPTLVGVVLPAISMVLMIWLARAKRRAAADLGSRALEADAFQTTACFWLSAIALAGLSLNAALGWWWADPLAALGMTPLLAWEGRRAWRGEECSC
jgi:divalent metal cation (Fe/Co/Zn/Cd) transporter